MKKFILMVIFINTIIITNASTTVPGGNIYSTTWTTAGSPYNVIGDIVIPNGETLSIDPGVYVYFDYNSGTNVGYHLDVQGKILAIGNVNNRIIFSAINTNIGWT